MVTDAEELLAELSPAQQGTRRAVQDGRTTRGSPGPAAGCAGSSIDELPAAVQRAARRDEPGRPAPAAAPRGRAATTPTSRRRLRVRPGITGLWQVSGRSDLSWEDTIRLDLYYVDNWSMLQDLTILARTLGAVFGSRGAY